MDKQPGGSVEATAPEGNADDVLIKNLAAEAKKLSPVVQAVMENAADDMRTKAANALAAVVEQGETHLARVLAITKFATEILGKTGVEYAIKPNTEFMGDLGYFTTQPKEDSLDGRILHISIKTDIFGRISADERDPLLILVRDARKNDKNMRDYVVINTEVAVGVSLKLKLLPLDAFQRFYEKNAKNVTNKATPEAICKLARERLDDDKIFDIKICSSLVEIADHKRMLRNLLIEIRGFAGEKVEKSTVLADPDPSPSMDGEKAGVQNTPAVPEIRSARVAQKKATEIQNEQEAQKRFEAAFAKDKREKEERKARNKAANDTMSEARKNLENKSELIDKVVETVAVMGAAAAAEIPQEQIDAITTAEKRKQLASTRREMREKRKMHGILNPRTMFTGTGDPGAAIFAAFLNSMPNPKCKMSWCKTQQGWLDQIGLIWGYLKGKKTTIAKVGKFIVESRKQAVLNNWDAPWPDLYQEVADLVLRLNIESGGLDPSSAFCRFINQNVLGSHTGLLKLARSRVPDRLALHYTAIFNKGKYPFPKPAAGIFASPADLMTRVKVELRQAVAKVPDLTTPDEKNGEGADFKLILDVLNPLIHYVDGSKNVDNFIQVVAVFLELKSAPDISLFINDKVFLALMAGIDGNSDALLEAAGDFLGDSPLMTRNSWMMRPEISNKLILPASLVVPEFAEDEDDERENAVEEVEAGQTGVPEDPVPVPTTPQANEVVTSGRKRKAVDASHGSGGAGVRRSGRNHTVSAYGRTFEMDI
jgi:hypothetical protein